VGVCSTTTWCSPSRETIVSRIRTSAGDATDGGSSTPPRSIANVAGSSAFVAPAGAPAPRCPCARPAGDGVGAAVPAPLDTGDVAPELADGCDAVPPLAATGVAPLLLAVRDELSALGRPLTLERDGEDAPHPASSTQTANELDRARRRSTLGA